MPIITAHRYTRAEIRANRDKLYVFGDNIAREGMGGQARAARGEPNSVGVPTKWRPSMREADFFRDEDIFLVMPRILSAFMQMDDWLQRGLTVVWPADGIGTGLAQLDRRAPAIASLITLLRGVLEKTYPSDRK